MPPIDSMHPATHLQRVRDSRPLVHHITNWVTIYQCAAMTRAFGALPVMAHAVEEAADMAAIASSLVLNIGTLTPPIVEAMIVAAKKANQRAIPVVLDAVGVGATPLRNSKAFELLDTVHIDIVKGNASEIARLAGIAAVTRGVESTLVADDLTAIARRLAAERNTVAVITGARDIVSSADRTWTIQNGHPLMGAVVGTGCMATSAIAAFAAGASCLAEAAAAALACYGIAGEIAAQNAPGPGAFLPAFFDAVHALDTPTVEKMNRCGPIAN